MTKNDWYLLLIRILGLYIVGIQLGGFITTFSSLLVILGQRPDWHSLPTQVWQAPLATGLAIAFGVFLAAKSKSIVAMFEGDAKS